MDEFVICGGVQMLRSQVPDGVECVPVDEWFAANRYPARKIEVDVVASKVAKHKALRPS